MAVLTGNSAANRLNGTTSADTLNGQGGNDTLVASSGNDLLIGGTGNDVLYGDAGNDTFLETASNGADTLNGGTGTDTVNYDDNSLSAVSLNVFTGKTVRNGQTDTLISIERVIGTDSLADTLIATGLTGNLSINLANGVLSGTARGFVSATRFEHAIGGSGNDLITGTSGVNTLNGGLGNDTLVGGAGNDLLIGNDGDDVFRETANNGADTLNGGSGTDTVTYDDNTSASPVTLNITAGMAVRNGQMDTLIAIEQVIGSDATSDTITAVGDNGAVSINLGNGVIVGANSGIVLATQFEHATGGNGNDLLIGSSENNSLVGGAGNDTLQGGIGQDTLRGGSGNDTLIIDSASHGDVLDGGDGFDTIKNTSATANITFFVGSNTIRTGAVNHTFSNIEAIESVSGSNDTIDASTETGAVTINLVNETMSSAGGSDVVSIIGFEHVIGSAYNDVVIGIDSGSSVNGGGGNDTLYALSTTNLTINGGAGDDRIDFGSGVDYEGTSTIIGGAGYDRITVAFPVILNVANNQVRIDDNWGGDGILVLDNTMEAIEATGGGLIDGSGLTGSGFTVNMSAGTINATTLSVTSVTGFQHVIGSDFNDSITAALAGGTLKGGAGNDTITGVSGGGMSGTTEFWGGAGNDLMNGMDSEDTYIFEDAWGTDTIIDLPDSNTGWTTLDFSRVTAGVTANLLAGIITDASGNHTINVEDCPVNRFIGTAGDDGVILNGTALTRFHAGLGNDSFFNFTAENYHVDCYDTGGSDFIEFWNDTEGFAFADVQIQVEDFYLADGSGGQDGLVDTLILRLGTDPDYYSYITIHHYFDNTSADDDLSGPGSGCIELMKFSDNIAVSFADIQAAFA